MTWVLKAHPLFEKDLKKLDKPVKERLKELIFRIKEDPNRFKPLRGYTGLFRVRFSNFRLVYALEGEIIWLIIVDKRKRVYREMLKRIK
ncbi:ParE toxin of type II toxin-antitoxin system, parDE [uncultured archaeon]|nr:ParE toxin of type II toxin-antitoxin system, parDE [uncultured archaeon]